MSIFSACAIGYWVSNPLLMKSCGCPFWPQGIGVVSPWRLAQFLLLKRLRFGIPIGKLPLLIYQVFDHFVVLADVSRIFTFTSTPGCPTIMVQSQGYLSRQQLTTFHVEVVLFFSLQLTLPHRHLSCNNYSSWIYWRNKRLPIYSRDRWRPLTRVKHLPCPGSEK